MCIAAHTKTLGEMRADEARILAGEPVSTQSENSVNDVPQEFKDWIEDNKDRIERAKSKPYFIRDNFAKIEAILNEKGGTVLVLLNQNLKDVAKQLGVKVGKPMTFEEADELRGNPHYAEDKSYRVNCQTCVVANEMRRRGLDIEALGNTKGSPLEKLSYHTESAWLDADGNIPTSQVVGAKQVTKMTRSGKVYAAWEKTVKTRKQLVSALEAELTDDGRYHIKWFWESGNSGHIITAERANGVLRYYDPQTGRIIKDFAGYIKKLKLATGIRYLRVDNLRANPAIVKNVLSKPTIAKGGKAAGGGTAKLPPERRRNIISNTRRWARENLPECTLPDGRKARRAVIHNANGNEVVVNVSCFDEIYSKNINRNNLAEIMNVAKEFKLWLPRAVKVGTEDGIHHSYRFNVYEVEVGGKRIQFKTKITDKEYLYNLRFI